MNLLVADLAVVTTLSAKGLLPRLLSPGRSVSMWDFLAIAILDGRDMVALDWIFRNCTRVTLLETAFAAEAPGLAQEHAAAGRRAGDRAKHDYGLLAAWAAATFAAEVKAGRRRADEFEALAEEHVVVRAFRGAGVVVHAAAWLEEA